MNKGELTRRAILDAAIERFGRDGYRATSVADITRDAGVGGTVAYQYFPNKEALFLAALDEDAAAVISEGLTSVLGDEWMDDWGQSLLLTLVAAIDRHPLARRVLGGLEPDVTTRVLEIPALAELRKAITEKLRTGQATGAVRGDIEPSSIADGVVSIVLALLMAVTQLGQDAAARYGADVINVIHAAIQVPRN